MEGLILAAGLGTRLRPLTDSKPKALVEIKGRTLLEIVAKRMADAGIKRIVVNVHAFGDMMIDFIKSHEWPCDMTISDERDMLLNTGGALKHAAPHFSGKESVLVHNVDIMSDIDLCALERHHLASDNLVTLCTSLRETKRKLLFDTTGNLAGIYGQMDDTGLTALAFSGVSIVRPQLFDLMPTDDHPYPVFGCYLEIAKSHRISYYMHKADNWADVGTVESLNNVDQTINIVQL